MEQDQSNTASAHKRRLHGVVSAKKLAAIWCMMIAGNAMNLARGVTDLRIHSFLCEIASCVGFWILYAITRRFWR